jgi:hypothetical protein
MPTQHCLLSVDFLRKDKCIDFCIRKHFVLSCFRIQLFSSFSWHNMSEIIIADVGHNLCNSSPSPPPPSTYSEKKGDLCSCIFIILPNQRLPAGFLCNDLTSFVSRSVWLGLNRLSCPYAKCWIVLFLASFTSRLVLIVIASKIELADLR